MLSRIFGATVGAILGFIAGLYVAGIALGLHEKAHVFGLALPCAAIASLVAAWGVARLRSRINQRHRPALTVVLAAFAIGAVLLLLRMIGAWPS